jgi:hypothetical protein
MPARLFSGLISSSASFAIRFLMLSLQLFSDSRAIFDKRPRPIMTIRLPSVAVAPLSHSAL